MAAAVIRPRPAGLEDVKVFSTQGNLSERQEAALEVVVESEVAASGINHIATAGNHSNGRENHCIDTGNHSNAAGNGGTRRKRPQKDTSDRSSEESFETEDDHISVKRDLDTNTQDFSGDLEDSSSQGWQLLDTCEPCNDEEVVKGRLKFFFMNLADKFHVTRTIPYHLCLQVKLQSKLKYLYTKRT